jgi:ribbon-helix-helix CopG family protein
MPLKPTTFRLDTEIMDALNEIRGRDGIPVSEQVRRALKQWIDAKGVMLTPHRKRAQKVKGSARKGGA